MKKTIYFVIVITLLLSGCASGMPTVTPISTNIIFSSESSTSTPHPTLTGTPLIKTLSSIKPSATLSSEQYPKLDDFVLRPEDVPNNTYITLGFYLWSGSNQNIPPSTKDLTYSLKEKNLCRLDCVKIEWTNADSYVDVSLIRSESMNAAIQDSFDLCTSALHQATLHWETPWAPASFDDCQSEMASKALTPYTWILGFNAADVYGSVLVVVNIRLEPVGDDFTVYPSVLHDLLELQIGKLNMLMFPISS